MPTIFSARRSLNSGFLRTVDDELSTKSYAAYANGSYEVVPNVRVSAGIRFTRETKDYFRTTSTFFSLLPAFNSTVRLRSAGRKVARYVADGQHRLAGDADRRWSMLALRRASNRVASTAARTPPRNSTKYDPETVWSYEAGFKTTVANQLKLNGSVFYNDYKDFQARVSGIDDDPVTGLPSPKLSVLNAGKMRIKGAELEAAWTPVKNLLIDSQLGYLDAKYKDFDDVRFPASAAAARSRRRPSRRSGRCGLAPNMRSISAALAASRSAARRATVRARRSRSTTRW